MYARSSAARALILLGVLGALASRADRRAARPATPDALATRIVEAFADGTAAAFDSVYPFAPGRAQVADASQRSRTRVAGLARVVWRDSSRAVLALSGYVVTGNAGAETLGTRAFADLYEARRGESGEWVLVVRIPIDSVERIRTHRIDVAVTPGAGLRVTDAMHVEAAGHGFAMRLNRAATIERVTVDGHDAAFAFDGGFLWVDSGARGSHDVAVTYEVPLPDDPRSWLAYTLPASGLARDQFVWHPILNYHTDADHATFDVTAHIPAAFHLSTSVAQRERVDGGVRTVIGRASTATPAISLLWDRAWEPRSLQLARMRFETFDAPGFVPARVTLVAAFREAFDVLRTHFGEPTADYFAVAQRREAPSSGWHFLTNSTIVTGHDGGAPNGDGPFPRAFLGHELAHAWTHPTGPAALFLMEGWATFAESLMLARHYGASTERAFWDAQRNAYLTGGYDGRVSLLGDDANGGVSYAKGAWVFRMLRDVIGAHAFDAGMRAFVHASSSRPQTIDAFIGAMSASAGRDVRPMLRPWLADSVLPAVTANVASGRVTLRATTALDQSIAIDIVTAHGTVRRVVALRDGTGSVDVRALGVVRDVVVDPDRRLLLRAA